MNTLNLKKTMVAMVSAALVAVGLLSCHPAHAEWSSQREQITATIICYSGGVVVYKGQAVGSIGNEGGGYHSFREAATGNRMNVGPNCIIREFR